MKWDWIVRAIYSEEDFGRSVATTVAGIVGLVVYTISGDWVVAIFGAVIAFPVCRVVASAAHARLKRKYAESRKRAEAEAMMSSFSSEEREVLRSFVRAGGACVSWSQANTLPFPRPALNSLMARGVLHTSVMEDGMTESFVLDVDLFDEAQRAFGSE